jgi:hypothetical protein
MGNFQFNTERNNQILEALKMDALARENCFFDPENDVNNSNGKIFDVFLKKHHRNLTREYRQAQWARFKKIVETQSLTLEEESQKVINMSGFVEFGLFDPIDQLRGSTLYAADKEGKTKKPFRMQNIGSLFMREEYFPFLAIDQDSIQEHVIGHQVFQRMTIKLSLLMIDVSKPIVTDDDKQKVVVPSRAWITPIDFANINTMLYQTKPAYRQNKMFELLNDNEEGVQ